MLARSVRWFSCAAPEDDAFQLVFPLDGHPQRGAQSREKREDGIPGRGLQVLFYGFSVKKRLLRERRLHRKMGPFLGSIPVTAVPNESVKSSDDLVVGCRVRICL